MKSKLVLFVALLAFTSVAFAQQNSTWDKWNWVMGKWTGEGSGEPGKGDGTFSFSLDLDKKVIIRKSHSEYSATDTKPSVIHDDLMIVYVDMDGNPSKAIYFDNEGHTINYQITYTEKSIILTSDKTSNAPVFRLTYSLLDNDTVYTKFEMSRDGVTFMKYIDGKSKKTN